MYRIQYSDCTSISDITYAVLQNRAFLNDLEWSLTWACRTSRELWMMGESQVGIMGTSVTLSSLTRSGFNTLSYTHTPHVTFLLECGVCLSLTLMLIDKYTSRNWWLSQDQIFQWHTFINTCTPCPLKTLFPDNCMLNLPREQRKYQKYNSITLHIPCE